MSMVTVYVDESGNLGRGGKYFVFGAIAFKGSAGRKRLNRLMRKKALRLHGPCKPIPELKCSKLKLEERQDILHSIASKADNDIFYLVAEKDKVRMLKMDRDKNAVYNYLAGHLVKRIIKKYNDNIEFIFDQKTTRVGSMNSLCDYLRILAYTNKDFNHDIIVRQENSNQDRNLQTADIISGCIYTAYRLQSMHFINILDQRIEESIEFPFADFEGGLLSRQ